MSRLLFPNIAHALAAALLTCSVVSHGLAQDAEVRETPAIELTQDQRDTIYQSVSKMQGNTPTPRGAQVALGLEIPSTVELAPMPQTAARLVPEARDMQVALVDRHVVVVEPQSRKVVAVIGFDERRDLAR